MQGEQAKSGREPNYYSIIPASVKRDKELNWNQRGLYAEIDSLTHERGFCWANNRYLAQVMDVEPRTIQAWLQLLEDRGHIKRGEVDGRRVIWTHASPITHERGITPPMIFQSPPHDSTITPPMSEGSPIIVKVNSKRNSKEEREGESARLPFESDFFLEAWKKWRRLKKGGWYKNVEQEELALKKLVKLARGREDFAIEIIEHSAANTYQGLFAPDHIKKQQHAPDRAAEQRAAFVRTFEGRF